jgi:hypothetical protein
MRSALLATAVMNVLAAVAFLPAGAPLRTAAGLPEGGHPFYLASVSMFVLTFGLGYLWAGMAGRAERLFIALAAIGKSSFVGLLVWFWLAGAVPARAVVLGSADLVFAMLFCLWLFGAHPQAASRLRPPA